MNSGSPITSGLFFILQDVVNTNPSPVTGVMHGSSVSPSIDHRSDPFFKSYAFIHPQKIKVIRYIRPKYACRKCEGTDSEQAVKIAPVPPQIIPKSIAPPGLLAYVLVSKFCDAIPFYRQEKQFSRIGIELSRVDFSNWAIQASRQCDPLIEVFLDEIQAGPAVQMDETRLQVMKELGRANTTKSYMWVIRGGPPENPVIVYRYHPSRSARIPLQYLSEYEGYLQTEGYEAYG